MRRFAPRLRTAIRVQTTLGNSRSVGAIRRAPQFQRPQLSGDRWFELRHLGVRGGQDLESRGVLILAGRAEPLGQPQRLAPPPDVGVKVGRQ
jgi:hypothetical protein